MIFMVLKRKYRQPARLVRREGVDVQDGVPGLIVTRLFTIGLSSKRGRHGGNSGGVGRVARRARRWPPGIRQRRSAIKQ